jgi:hypothetical protein
LLQPARVGRLEADAANRWICWGTIGVPWRLTLSPVFEWRSGFPYSVVDARRYSVGGQGSFPSFLSADLAVAKKLSIKAHEVRLEVQLFGLTHHFNPRDVYSVAGSTRFGTFANSVGVVVRGDIGVDW